VTDTSPINIDQEIQLAMLDSQQEIDLYYDAPTAPDVHQFKNSEYFPSLTEWSKLDIENEKYLFNGIQLDNYKKHNVTVTMASTNSGFKNMLGKYTVDDQGIMRSVGMLVQNTRDVKSGEEYSFFQDSVRGDLQFFLIANGHSYNKNLDDVTKQNGSFKFVVGFGTDGERLAKVTDEPQTIDLVYDIDGKTDKVAGNVYHTTSSDLNSDNKAHSISGVTGQDGTQLRIGFEDFPNLGDRDFNDVVFDVSITYAQNEILQSLVDIEPASGDVFDRKDALYGELDELITGLLNGDLSPQSYSNNFGRDEFLSDLIIDSNHVLSDINEVDDYADLDKYIEDYLEATFGPGTVDVNVSIETVGVDKVAGQSTAPVFFELEFHSAMDAHSVIDV
jgi:hypothetical protein